MGDSLMLLPALVAGGLLVIAVVWFLLPGDD